MTHPVPNTGIPSPILLGIFVAFGLLWAITTWRDRRRNRANRDLT